LVILKIAPPFIALFEFRLQLSIARIILFVKIAPPLSKTLFPLKVDPVILADAVVVQCPLN